MALSAPEWPAEWPAAAVLEGNRQRLLRETRATMRRYELRYELRSADLEAALRAGTIRETWEVCDWLFALRTHRELAETALPESPDAPTAPEPE